MAYPLDNFGDYNIVRNDLKETDGNVETLYKNFGAVFIAKARPQIYKEGCWTGFDIGAGAGVGICVKTRRDLIFQVSPVIIYLKRLSDVFIRLPSVKYKIKRN